MKHVNRRVILKHTGYRGLKGDKGDKGDTPLYVGPDAPNSPDFLWVDTDEEPQTILTTDNIPDSPTHRYTNDNDITRLSQTSGVNTGDQDLSNYVTSDEILPKADKNFAIAMAIAL